MGATHVQSSWHWNIILAEEFDRCHIQRQTFASLSMLLLVSIWMDQAKVQEVGKGLHPLRISWNLTWCMCLASCWRRIDDFYNTATILVICESCRILVKQKNCLPPFQAASHFPPASKLWKSTMAFGSPACRLIPVPFFPMEFHYYGFWCPSKSGDGSKNLNGLPRCVTQKCTTAISESVTDCWPRWNRPSFQSSKHMFTAWVLNCASACCELARLWMVVQQIGNVSLQFDPSRSFFVTLQRHFGKTAANQGS